jgi:hypothetical protein
MGRPGVTTACGVAHAVGHAVECTAGPDNDEHCGAHAHASTRGGAYRATFNHHEYLPYRRPGTASIQGSAVVAELDTPSGLVVILKPVTSLSREWWARTVKHGEASLQSASPWEAYDRVAQVDSSGSFRFDALPAGRYFLASRVPAPGPTPRWIGAEVKVDSAARITTRLEPIN